MRGLAWLALLCVACGDDDTTPVTADAAINIDDSGVTPDAAADARPADARPADAFAGPDANGAGCTPVAGTPALQLEEVARNLTQPIVIAIPDGEDRIFVAEKGGKIRIIENGVPRATDFLDLSAKVSKGSEQGLLGMAFHPHYRDNGRFFVSFTDLSGDSRIWEYRRSADRNVAETQEFEILFQDQPSSNHNGGQILFGPDDKLYILFGDGGSQYDPSGNGQSLNTYLAKVLRIDIDVIRPEKYAIPADNPFASMGAPVKGEIWVYGLRNPWRMSFDRQTGEAWIGDVGQDKFEEIDHVPAGGKGLNFGWGAVEGKSHCPKPPYEGTCTVAGETLPVFDYGHGVGNAVVGGFVYRGCKMPGWHATYFFSDNGGGFVRSFKYAGAPITDGMVTVHADLARNTPGTFGEDLNGELLLCSLGLGRCYRVVPKP